MKTPLISVILPVYNMERYLPRCLDSILENTYKNLQILCVDDGSRDGSAEILRQYAVKDGRISIITKQNGGLSSARNAGLEQVKGDYVSFIDTDDYVHPQFFELLLSALEAVPGADISMCGVRTVWNQNCPAEMERIRLSEAGLRVVDSRELYKDHNLRSFCWNRLYPAELALKARFREELRYSEDTAYVAELGEAMPDVSTVVLPDALYYYCQRDGSLARTATLEDRMDVIRIFAEKALSSKKNERIYLDLAIKRCLSIRYLAGRIYLDDRIRRESDALLKRCLKRLSGTEVYSGWEKLCIWLLGRVPFLYWLFRSVTEPYMRRWEVIQRRKRRAERKAARKGSGQSNVCAGSVAGRADER